MPVVVVGLVVVLVDGIVPAGDVPRDPTVPAVEQEDPRTELVSRLLEHEKFKSAAQMLLQKQQIEEAVVSNPALREFQQDAGAELDLAVDVIDLVRVFRDVLERARNRPVLNVDEDAVTVSQMIQYLRRRLTMEDKPVRLKQLLRALQSQAALICAFLAVLELVRLQAVQLRQDNLFGDILVRKHIHFDSAFTEVSTVPDDGR